MAASAPRVLAGAAASGDAGGGAPRWRVALAAVVCWCLFVNHYARDVTGALEREMEVDLGISPGEFQALNAVYFGPNIVVPLLAGALAQRVGAGRLLLAAQLVAAVGHVAVACGVQARSYGAVLFGRAVLGVTYESIDVMPLPLLAPRFGDAWGSLVGVFNSALRLGSVANFALSPLAYGLGGLPLAFWLSAAMGLSGLAAALAVRGLERRSPAPAADDGQDDVGQSPRVDGTSFLSFGLYVATGALVYSSIVPFWFYGGAFIRDKWGYSLQAADALMLFPEGSMVVLSPPIGLAMDRVLRGPRFLVVGARILACGLLAVVAGFLLLIAFPAAMLPPVAPLAVLGVAYAASNTVLWSLSSGVVPPGLYALGGGLVGSALNLGPTALPLLMVAAPSEATALSWLAMCAAAAAVGAAGLAVALGTKQGPKRGAFAAALLCDATSA